MAKIQRRTGGPPRVGKWIGNSITDWDNETVDVGRVSVFFIVFGLVSVVIFAMLLFTGYDVMVNKNKFDPQSLGIGVGGLLGGISTVLMGLGVYLFGDSRSRETVEAFQPQPQVRGQQHGTTQQAGQDYSRYTTASTTTTQAKSGTTFTVTEEGNGDTTGGATGEYGEGTGEPPIDQRR